MLEWTSESELDLPPAALQHKSPKICQSHFNTCVMPSYFDKLADLSSPLRFSELSALLHSILN